MPLLPPCAPCLPVLLLPWQLPHPADDNSGKKCLMVMQCIVICDVSTTVSYVLENVMYTTEMHHLHSTTGVHYLDLVPYM